MSNSKLFFKVPFVISTAISTFSATAVTTIACMMSINKKSKNSLTWEDLAVPLVFAGLDAVIANYFQGKYMADDDENQDTSTESSKNSTDTSDDIESGNVNNGPIQVIRSASINNASSENSSRSSIEDRQFCSPSNFLSYSVELFCHALHLAHTAFETYFLFMAVQLWISDEHSDQSVDTLPRLANHYVYAVFGFVSLINYLFSASTDGHVISELSAKKCGEGEEKTPLLIDKLLSIFKNKIGRFFVAGLGTLFHVVLHILALLVLLPPEQTKKWFRSLSTVNFVSISSAISVGLLYLTVGTLTQTVAFDTKISLDQLREDETDNDTVDENTSLLATNNHLETNNNEVIPFLKKIASYSSLNYYFMILTQSVVHGLDKMFPFVVFLHQLYFNDAAESQYVEISLIAVAAFITFFSTAVGHWKSEGKEAIEGAGLHRPTLCCC